MSNRDIGNLVWILIFRTSIDVITLATTYLGLPGSHIDRRAIVHLVLVGSSVEISESASLLQSRFTRLRDMCQELRLFVLMDDGLQAVQPCRRERLGLNIYVRF